MQVFTVHRLDDDDAPGELLGQVALDEANRLSVLGDEDEADDDLMDALEEVNEAEALIMPVRPDDDAPPRSVAKARITRDDPRFAQAVADNFRRWHELLLRPAAAPPG